MLPLVSIVIPVYNGAAYMREAIDSALAQTYPNVEVIVVNDGSTDNGETEKIASSYGNRIRYYSKENGGVSTALNYGIRQMKGEYFSWLSHDDVYSPDKIKRQMDLLLATSDRELIALCNCRQIDKDSSFLPRTFKRNLIPGINDWQAVLMDLLQNGAFHGCAFLIPRSVFDKVGFFHEGLRYSQDTLMWMEIFTRKLDLLYDDSAAVYSRVHGGQLTERGRHLFVKDSMAIGDLMVDRLAKLSNKDHDYLYAFAHQYAVYNVGPLVERCIRASKSNMRFSPAKVAVLRIVLLYAKIRPLLRKMYYHLIQRAYV